MQKFHLLIIALGFLLSACSLEPNADKIIKKSVAFYGMDKLESKTITFDFRKKHFEVKLNDDNFFYQSTQQDSLGLIKDQLSNHGFVREINGLVIPLSAKDSVKYAESLNSVIYFALLPLKLQDDAVNAVYLRKVQVKGTEYHQIEVSFNKDDGGSHHDDVYYFWFDAADHSMDYFAYSAGGNRFRAINGLVKVGDIYFQNYYNLEYKGNDKRPLKDYHILFEQDKLSLLSEIKLENIKIK